MIKRFSLVGLLAIIISAIMVWFYPDQAGVLGSKIATLMVGGLLGYGLDRAVFPYGRPHEFMSDPRLFAWCMIRRSIIVAASTLSMALTISL